MNRREIVFQVVEPNGQHDGYGFYDRPIKDFITYEDAEKFVRVSQNSKPLRIDKISKLVQQGSKDVIHS